MAKPYITLSFDGITVTLDTFLDSAYPRIPVQEADSQRSLYGVFTRRGYAYEPPYLWQFTTLVTPTTGRLLQGIYAAWDSAIRARTDSKILVTDTTLPHAEKGTRTRNTAPSPWNTVTTIATGHISYYAQYYAEFSQPLDLSKPGSAPYWAVGVSLEESDQKVPIPVPP